MKKVGVLFIGILLLVFCVSFVSALTLNVVPFILEAQGNATAQWITSDKKSGTYSVDLNTTPSAGDYSYLTFAPMVSTIDNITSLSFYYKHVSNNGWAGPRIGIMINYSGTYYLIVSGAASTNYTWSKADGISGENLTTNDPSNPNKVWWYGTCDVNGLNYNQTAGSGDTPVNFDTIKSTLNGNIMHFSIYMGVVNDTNVSNGEAYIDDIEINGITYYGKIQDAIDTAISDDTIHVNDGTYNENVTVNKPLRIAGSGYSSTSIINCSGSGTGMLINSSNIIVSGFKIINCENGIYIQGTTNTIVNNSFNFNINGINISEALNNKINFNLIEGNTEFGINNVDNDIVNATFNWWGDCTGPYHIINPNGKGDNVSDKVDYSPWFGICIVNKSDANCTFETDNVTLKADLIGIEPQNALISYTINGTNHNKTALIIGNKVQAEIPSNELVGGMNVTWNVYVNDPTGRLYNNSWKTFYVRNITKLIVDPESPNGKDSWYITEPTFTLTKDNNGTNSYYQWDSNNISSYTAPFGLENIPNLPKETAGILELNWWTEFDCGNETKQDYTFYIDLTDPLIKNLQPANSSIVYNNLRPTISAYLDEVYGSNSGINLSMVMMKLDGGIVSANINATDTIDAIINYTPTTDLWSGKHNVTINVTDNAGRNSELTWFFGICEAPVFTIIVNSPQDGIYGSRIIPFNISLNTTVKILEYINYNDTRARWGKLCKDCNEYGNNSKRTKTLNEGNNTITIRATDSFGNVKEKNISLFIDSRPPRIIKTLPRRNEVTNGTGFYIKYTEDNPKKVELFWNGNKTLNCTAGINQECRIDVNLSDHDGEFIDYYFNVTDLLRTVKSRITRIKVDTKPPILNITMPKNSTNGETRRNVPFNITISEDVLLEYYDKSDSRAIWKRLCSNCDDYGNSSRKTKYFREGIHDLLIRATDKAGQSDIKEVILKIV